MLRAILNPISKTFMRGSRAADLEALPDVDKNGLTRCGVWTLRKKCHPNLLSDNAAFFVSFKPDPVKGTSTDS